MICVPPRFNSKLPRAAASAVAVEVVHTYSHVTGLPKHVIDNAVYQSAGLNYATFCALSVALAALLYNLFGNVAAYFQLQHFLASGSDKRVLLHGVDVTNSYYLRQPEVLRAVEFAANAHAGQHRKTGEPYVSHCIETALIVEANLPTNGDAPRLTSLLMAAVLHDVLEDTTTQLDALIDEFGEQTASMVDTVSQLSQINQIIRRDRRLGYNFKTEEGWQRIWSKLRSMMLNIVTAEPLVVLVKLADRLHNMRTVYALKPEKQQSIAEETLQARVRRGLQHLAVSMFDRHSSGDLPGHAVQKAGLVIDTMIVAGCMVARETNGTCFMVFKTHAMHA